MRIGIVQEQIIAHRLDHDSRHLRATRPIEVGDRCPVLLAAERWEMFPERGNGDQIGWIHGVKSEAYLLHHFCRKRAT